MKFLRDYANVDMPKRSQNYVRVEKEDIKSGDFLAIIRISGLETMQVWGTGARTGHTAVAMWDEAGELWVMESPDKTNYWPNPNIQKTKWDDWIDMSKRAQYNVVLLPLSDESRSKFNASAALDYFRSVEGVPYGYHNFIWGWVDTEQDNWPGSLSHQLVEVGFALVEHVSPFIAKRMLSTSASAVPIAALWKHTTLQPRMVYHSATSFLWLSLIVGFTMMAPAWFVMFLSASCTKPVVCSGI